MHRPSSSQSEERWLPEASSKDAAYSALGAGLPLARTPAGVAPAWPAAVLPSVIDKTDVLQYVCVDSQCSLTNH
eukprot:5761407-Amphidinium_carterae.1